MPFTIHEDNSLDECYNHSDEANKKVEQFQQIIKEDNEIKEAKVI